MRPGNQPGSNRPRRADMSRITPLAALLIPGFAAVALVVGAPGSTTASVSGSAPVTVLNTPLPVAGSVAASQSGGWAVDVNTLPSVTVGSLPDVNVASLPPV